MHKTAYQLVDGGTHAFVVGTKNCLKSQGVFDNERPTWNIGYPQSERAPWCDEYFYNAFPSTIKPLFKKFIAKSGSGINNEGEYSYPCYFALFAVCEVTGEIHFGETSLIQLDYYKTEPNRVKHLGDDSPTPVMYHTRTTGNTREYNGQIETGGESTAQYLWQNRGLAFVGCI